MAKVDRFARIAAAGAATEEKKLIRPENRKPFDRILPLAPAGHAEAVFEQKGSVEEEVRHQLQQLREYYTPFMEEHAPEIPKRKRIRLSTFQWRIATPEDHRNFTAVLDGAGEWEMVTIPHYGAPLGKAETIYRTTFELDSLPSEGEAMFLRFRGVDYKAKVILNGDFLGVHEGFFAPFEFDCTGCITRGTNVLVVCVENDYVNMGNNDIHTEGPYKNNRKPVSGDKIYAATGPGYDDPEVGWHHCPPGMGIYQEVYLERRPRMFLGDLYVRPMLQQSQAEINMEAFRCDPGDRKVTFRISVYGRNFEETVVEDLVHIPTCEGYMGEDTGKSSPLYLEKGMNYYKVTVPMGQFRLWEPEAPWLYEAHIRMIDEDGTVLDTGSAVFGMRSFTMDTVSEKKGMMYLNGKKIRLRGANTMGFEQQDVMKEDWDRLIDDILLAKACNMNFLRLTQRPVQDEIYQYCDMLGLLIQTDFPLFACLSRSQFAEALRQVAEMERLVRGHACVILDTYINEPTRNAHGAPHRCLTREHLEEFFEAADIMVHLENPDRVTKHVDGDYDPPGSDMPDNHCYTAWYNGHGLDAGSLYKGDWIEVRPGWYYGCGEFGAEGLEDESTMRRYYPQHWLPQNEEEDAVWTPGRIVYSQSESFHYFFYETPTGLGEWIRRSQAHQAEATKWMTEAFRRDADMVSFAIHLFIDAFPAGWMKTIVDVDRNRKPAFYAYRDALTPTMVSLRTDRLTYFPGEEAQIEVWLCNDRPEVIEGAKVIYEAELPDGSRMSGSVDCDIEACGVTYAGELVIPMPGTDCGKAEGAIREASGNEAHGKDAGNDAHGKDTGNEVHEKNADNEVRGKNMGNEAHERNTRIETQGKDTGIVRAGYHEDVHGEDTGIGHESLADTIRVRAAIIDREGCVLHRNSLEVRVFHVERKEGQLKLYTPNPDGLAARLIRELQEEIVDPKQADCILIDHYDDYTRNREELDRWAAEGHKLVFMELPVGHYEICGQELEVSGSAMSPLHFVSRDTGHEWVKGFGGQDFSKWYSRSGDRITPLLESTFTGDAFAPVLTSGSLSAKEARNGRRDKILAAGRMAYGKGSIVVCQVKLAGHVQDNPVAWMFAERMLG